jgi:hypothetical protein
MEDVHAPDPELESDLRKFTQRFVALATDDHARVLSHWILHTWLFDAANVTPYLYIYSSDPGSGKTRLLEVLGVLARNARRADNMTAPVMFKIISRERPTLLIDEVDTIWSGSRNEPKRNVLNTGYKRGGCAWREQARELIQFPTFSPKVLAGINNGFMPSTVRDRCIPIEMRKRGPEQKVERFVETRISRSIECEMLLSRIVDFCELFFVDVKIASVEPMASLSDRQDEICEPLLAIATVLGTEEELRGSLERVFASAGKTQPSPEQIIFGRIRNAFGDDRKIFTEDLCSALGPMYANGRTLALFLADYAITPKDIRIGNRVARGYEAIQFEDAWRRFLGIETIKDEPVEEIAS